MASLDIAKGIGIFLLVLKHNTLLKEHAPLFFAAISTFSVPLFLLLSGAFLPDLLAWTFVTKRVKVLYRPYLVGVVLAMPLQLVNLTHPVNHWFPLGVLWATGNSVMNAPLWFLSNLVVVAAFIFLVDRLSMPTFAKPVLGFACFIFGIWLTSLPAFVSALPKDELGRVWGLPWSMDIVLPTAGLVMLGRGLADWMKHPVQHAVKELCILLAFAAIFAMAFETGRPELDLNNRLAVHVVPLLVCSLAGMGLMISLSRCLTLVGGMATDTIQKFGASSLVVLICHWPLQQVFIRILKRVEPSAALAMAASAITCLLVYVFAERVVAPHPLLRKLFTGR